MRFWIDAQLSPGLADWLFQTFGVEALSLRDLGLLEAVDTAIFEAARAQSSPVVVMTKDSDFVDLIERRGSPPQILWITCGNSSNAKLQAMLLNCFPSAMARLGEGEPIVEIGDQA